MVNVPVRPADQSSAQTADQFPGVDIDAQHRLQAFVHVGQDLIQTISLRDRPGKSVEDRPGLAVWLLQSLSDHGDGDVIRHQLAFIHVAPGVFPQIRFLLQVAPKNIAAGDVGQIKFLGQPLGLRPLASSWRSEHHQKNRHRLSSPARISGPAAPDRSREA